MNVRSTVAGSGDLARIAELTPQANANVRHQHVISQVLLREFAMPGKRVSGRHVQPYDLRHPERRLKTRAPRGVAQIENFVPFASASLEDLWGAVERELPNALDAVKAGDAFNDPHIGTVLRDLIALHYVRSQHYRELFHRLFVETYHEQRRWLLTDGAPRLQAAVLERTGLHTAGPQGLAARADEVLDVMMTTYHNGSLLRVRIEDSFGKARQFISRTPLEILEPEDGEFLIGDNPALTVRHRDDLLLYSMALGDAHSTVLPIGPRYMLALGPADRYATASKADVDRMNVLQIKASRRYVYTRPGSPLAPMIREVSHHWLADHDEVASA
ncbi:DUF4238 domain-containing protein [Streptomyces sp. NPDC048643]|uniref:DUF4238 domain-containing protein n=1 Tax=Streptomyces sp. NPDC048643 TaxID=3155637 RepID=UPI003421943D